MVATERTRVERHRRASCDSRQLLLSSAAVQPQVEAALLALGRGRSQLLACARDRRLFLVGGAVRDALLGRTPTDLDFAVSGSGYEFGRLFSQRTRSKLVILSEADDEVRVVIGGRTLDFNGLGDKTIESDLARRDFTVNALAVEITAAGVGPVLDVAGGLTDLNQRLIRPVSDQSLVQDPLRLLRAVRLGLELGFRIDDQVFTLGHQVSLAATAPERIGAELLRILESPGSYEFIRRLDSIGRLAEILPELQPVLADEQLREHSFRTYQKIEEIIDRPGFFGRFEPEWRAYFDSWGLAAPTAEPPASTEPTAEAAPAEPPAPLPFRRGLLKLAGLLHDIAKPETRFTNSAGEVHFYGHDSIGAKVIKRLARERLRLSRHQTEMLVTLAAEHMRLHLLATSSDLTERAIRRYWRDLGPEGFGLMILCVADGWATAGRTTHLEDTITRMIEQKRAEDAVVRVRRLVTGDDLIRLGLKPGPAFKVILQELEELQIEGRITSTEQGIEYLKTHLAGLAGATDR